MPQLPPTVWIIIAGIALLLLALCAATAYLMLRPATRRRVAGWPLARILVLVGAAAIPWLIVSFAPITVKVSINGVIQLAGWLSLALLAFAMLVLLPLTALVSAIIWGRARRRTS
jgi:hypothetical protein